MQTRLCISALAVGILLLVPHADAQEYGPDNTQSFIPYCTDHFDACRSSAIAQNNLNVMSVMAGKSGCTFPRNAGQSYHDDTITATKAILVWLNAHQASLKPKTSDAITQAEMALWPKQCH